MITVGIVEDNERMRNAFTKIIAGALGFSLGLVCTTAEEALREFPRQPPDVVLMDVHLPNLSGVEATARLKGILPKVQVIMITVYENSETVFKALRAGACGYLLKRASPDEIIAAIKEVTEGGAPMTSEIARMVVAAFQQPVPRPATDVLSRRETEILELLAKGFANKEISNTLHISVETVRTHLRKIYEKLHVHSRTEAVVKFLDN